MLFEATNVPTVIGASCLWFQCICRTGCDSLLRWYFGVLQGFISSVCEVFYRIDAFSFRAYEDQIEVAFFDNISVGAQEISVIIR